MAWAKVWKRKQLPSKSQLKSHSLAQFPLTQFVYFFVFLLLFLATVIPIWHFSIFRQQYKSICNSKRIGQTAYKLHKDLFYQIYRIEFHQCKSFPPKKFLLLPLKCSFIPMILCILWQQRFEEVNRQWIVKMWFLFRIWRICFSFLYFKFK